jgi:Cu+-exporting ATPase
MIKEPQQKTTCYHCGENCEEETIQLAEKSFCCQGCKTVYEILNKVELCDYYSISNAPGVNQKNKVRPEKFAFLEDVQLQQKLIHFKNEKQSHITFYLPQMHCSSCIWLLENLPKLDHHIIRSEVNFLKKEVSVVFDHTNTSLRNVADLLTSIGYEPHFSLNDLGGKKIKKYDKSRIYKIGITGFCFGNIMLLSFPEYFSLGEIEEKGLKELFSYLILFLSLPVFFYGASEFFSSAFKSLKQRYLNIDAPIALAVLITFGRSVYEIISGNGAGYMDSMSGIVFFMLIGRFFQDKTYNTMAFTRDYTSYFPLGVTVVNSDGIEKQVPVSNIKVGDRIKIHSNEIIPADSILFYGNANIDQSFVTGESLPIEKSIGEIIYAGGKQLGGALELEVVKDVSQSYLTSLWNNDAFKKNEQKGVSYIHTVSKYFTVVLFAIAIASAIYWQFHDPSKVWNAVTSILIVACPCALLLSATFTNGNMLRVLQGFGFFARNAGVIEQVAAANSIVFDKTGTITEQTNSGITYQGTQMDEQITAYVRSLAAQSSHPLSKAIVNFLPHGSKLKVKSYVEKPGAGVMGFINDKKIAIGSHKLFDKNAQSTDGGTRVYVQIEDRMYGYFLIEAHYREGLTQVLEDLKKRFKLSLISGDNDSEYSKLKHFFDAKQYFNRSPQDKLEYIEALQTENKKVIMIGDGLNDAGALRQSNVGIAITDNVNNFSPACDVILDGTKFAHLSDLLKYCTNNKLIINISFVVSIIYNIIGLYFAAQGSLQPVIAAILMPVSSISIVLLTTGLSSILAIPIKRKYRLSETPNSKTDINHMSI